tara:strand:+ start:23081 stop:23452 length:372 start_codon:yes stop_codon:yes gene_type:complete
MPAISTTTENMNEIETEIRCRMIWVAAVAAVHGIAVDQRKMQRTRVSASESAMLPEHEAMIGSKMSGTIETAAARETQGRTGMIGATTIDPENTAGTENETEGRIGMFQAACKTACLEGGIRS